MNTIDLLAAVGSDASLRYASPENLQTVLSASRDRDVLLAAVATGDMASLNVLAARKSVQAVQAAQWISDEEMNLPN